MIFLRIKKLYVGIISKDINLLIGGMDMKALDYTILILVIVGAVNWGLIGFFSFDLVRMIFGNMTTFSRIIYALVGLSGLYALSYFGRIRKNA